MNKLLKDAIADAKAVRETALAQAKLALEEAFAPKLQSMLSNKIKEEMEEEPEMDPSMDDEAMRMRELAGLAEKRGEEDMDGEDMGDDDMGGEDFSSDDMGGGEEDFSSDDMGGEEEFSSDEEDMDFGDEKSDEDEDLEEILRQLEEEEMSTDDEMETEVTDEELPMADRNKQNYGQGDMDEEINLDELIQALREEEGDEDYEKSDDQGMDTPKHKHGNPDIGGKPDPMDEAKKMKKMKKMEEELNEAYDAVRFLREKLSEVNLLNAKLLYVNKLFRKNGLSEAQKVKIIETFDRAKNVRETKLIYATLSESIMAPVKGKKPVVENFASAPVKKTRVITEGNEQANRFKQLAGIIKS